MLCLTLPAGCHPVVWLQVRDGLSDNVLTPPSVARFIGIYSATVYQAFALWSPPNRRFKPLSSELMNATIPSEYLVAGTWYPMLRPSGPVPSPNTTAGYLDAQGAAISGAASKLLTLFFSEAPQSKSWLASVKTIIDAANVRIGNSDRARQQAAFLQGEAIAECFYR